MTVMRYTVIIMEKTLYQSKLPKPSNYKYSFILRLWRVEEAGIPNWQASVETTETGERIGFASLEQLFAFLIDYTEVNCNMQTVVNIGKETSNI